MSQVKISEIRVGERMRKDLGDINELAGSLSRLGLLQPIVVDRDHNLLAGQRRLEAAKLNHWEDIDVVYFDDLDEATAKEIELEENLRRKDFYWVEEVLGLQTLYRLRQDRYGAAKMGGPKSYIINEVEGKDAAGYSQQDLARDLERSDSPVNQDLMLAVGLVEFPQIREEKTKTAAFKRYKLLKMTALREEAASRTRMPGPAVEKTFDEYQKEKNPDQQQHVPRQSILKTIFRERESVIYHADARDVLRFFADKEVRVDCIVTDPPFGLKMHIEGKSLANSRLAENVGSMYDDDPHLIMDMLDETFGHAAKVLKDDGHAYVFFHMSRYETVYLMLRKHFGEDACDETPILWVKNTPGIGDPNRAWVYAYEPCFFINRGRSLVKPQAFNYLKYDTIPPGQKIHPTEKPAALLRHLITASCVRGELVLDPFAGSGSTLVAADQVGCKFIGIEKHEPFYRASVERLAERIHEHKEAEAAEAANGVSQPVE